MLNTALLNSAAGFLPRARSARPARVLIVEDDPGLGAILTHLVEKSGHVAVFADGGQSGIERAQANPPDLILLDILMPEIDGFTVSQHLQADERTRHIPIIFVTALGSTNQIVHGLNLGAVDYVTKPFNFPELSARVNNALRLKARHDELRRTNAELAALALLDPLTGLHNRRYLKERLAEATAHSARYRDPLACLMLDLDHFKQVNDRFGHGYGDEVLKELAGVLKSTVRTADSVGRFGGEEFLAVCPATEKSAAGRLAERIRVAVANHEFRGPAGRAPVTVSVGYAVYDPARDADDDAFVVRADAALYAAKAAGRNCVRGD